MIDLYFAVVFLLTIGSIGLPLASLMPRELFPWRMLAAPVLGYILVTVVATILYQHGVSIWAFIYVAFAAAPVGLAYTVLTERGLRTLPVRKSVLLTVASGLIVLVLVVAPKWSGGPRYAVFQGNKYDQLDAMTEVATYRAAPRGELYKFSQQPLIAFGKDLAYDRPASKISLAAFSKALKVDTIDATYAYLASLQSLTFFALAFLIVEVFTAPIELALMCAAAGTLGFPMQYLFDISAWGKLAGMPIAVTGLTMLLTVVDTHEPTGKRSDPARIVIIFAIVAAGISYVCAEMIPLYASAALGCLVPGLIVSRRKRGLGRLLPVLLGLAIGGLTTLFFWQGTIEFLISNLNFLVGPPVDWWKYFQAYLIARPSDFLTSAIGLYFILPPQLPTIAAAPWRLAVYSFTAAVLVSAAVAWTRADVLRSRAVLLLSGTLFAVAVIATTALAGRFWLAGDGLAMIAPVLFVVLVAPLFLPAAPKTCRLVGLSFAGLYLGFGLVRPLRSANGTGVIYSWPYPAGAQDQLRKFQFDWDVNHLAQTLDSCGSLVLDINDLFLERYLAIYLTDHQHAWISTHPPLGKFDTIQPRAVQPAQSADCILTDGYPEPGPARKVISVATEDKRLVNYLNGGRPALEIGVRTPGGVRVVGAYGVEFFQGGYLRWTSAETHFLIPNNPAAPTSSISMTTWRVAPGRRVTVSINGKQVYNGLEPSDSGTFRWTVQDRSAQLIDFVIATDEFHAKGDSRGLGVALRSVVLSR